MQTKNSKNEMKYLSKGESRRLTFLIIWIIILSTGLFINCKSLTNQARAQTSKLRCEDTTRIVNGQFDYGVEIAVEVRNVGGAGTVNIKAQLSTSEGEWQREQNLDFSAGQSRELKFFFDEPTINANNPQCKVAVYPRAG